ncbi:hypothetical protein [Shewanella pealeana]|uniref:Uncharacterized protein n=1 Tax=Shewanella pealeana (strain ATCC 700345 / ANG-SQ1) TaxID=398579 RepID=A8H342_SHEPA|nr:hypothetical protein [Shewanella pealeana]ABV86979.1 conserved hypothetical protein [Shewanella pealeana ATCC 700345]
MNLYSTLGFLNTIFILISLIGVFSQLQKIWKRKKDLETKDNSSELLSLNQFSVSFLAYFSFFIYGYSIEPFNHYIVWPRLIASLLVGLILFEIWQDRKNKSSTACLSVAIAIFILGSLGLSFGNIYTDESKLISSSLIVVVTLLIAQGYYHQIMLIARSGQTGAVDLRMSQFILMMDISTIAFALSMGLSDGWPLFVLATVSGITKLNIMFLFRWVRLSKTAQQRRNAYLALT